MKTRRIGKSITGKCAAVLALAFATACLVFALPAYANVQLDAPTTVSDDIARVHVAKLDADTHSYVVGAAMQIVDKESGEVIREWMTDGSTEEIEKGNLVVDRVYILRELSAPDGYAKVDDVEFVVNATEGTGLTIVSGTSGQYELTESYKVNLYDEPFDTENETVVTETRGVSSNTTKAVAPKTGDETPLLPVAMLAVAGIATILILQVPKRKMQ